MLKENFPDFKNKTVLFRTANLESDSTIEDPVFEQQYGRLFVTGKLWSKLFEIKLVPVE